MAHGDAEAVVPLAVLAPVAVKDVAGEVDDAI
jgi:hypothetical protein